MAKSNIYLHYNGNCEEAFNHYRKAIGGDFQTLMRFKDAPNSDPNAAEGDGIIHVALPMGGGTYLMGSDFPESMGKAVMGTNFSVSISADTAADAHRIFDALLEGGQVTMPLSQTFWSPLFGMGVDKFGVAWMVGLEAPQA